jgi:hypothetical protein
MKKLFAIMIILLAALWTNTTLADHTPDPTVVTIAGSLQDELGCPGDWQPDCAATHLAYDADDDVWQQTFAIPAGNWEYKAALNDSWDENYGGNATQDGPNIPLNLADPTDVKFYYDHKTHWVTDNMNSVIATAPGSYQSELGCTSDWDPSCLRSWLQDLDGDGIFTFSARLPAGNYEVKVAIDESWAENYGAGGVQNGPNIPFTVPSDCVEMLFSFDYATKILTVDLAPPPEQPATVTIAGSLQDELGCPGDWQPDCAATHLSYDGEDGVWQETFSIPAGNWEYKAALNNSWDENYGANAQRNGPNIPLNLGDPTDVKFYYDHKTHWVADNVNSAIATAPGNYQSEIGCTSDWDPSCLRSWLQDPDGDGIFTFSARLPAGNYEVKVAIGESWDENYGDGGVQNGPNIPFTVPSACTEVSFSYDHVTHILAINGASANNPPEVSADTDPVSVDEGETATNSGVVTDADGDTVTLSASVGTVVNNNDGTWSWSFLTSDGPDDSQIVTITADDGNGGVSQTTFEMTVNNVVPTINSVTNDGPIAENSDATIVVSASDPAGANDPLSYEFDCDNDSTYEIGPQPGASASCGFDEANNHLVNVRVADDDGGVSEASTTVVVLTPQDAIDDLITEQVEDLEDSGVLNHGQGNAFTSKLENAIKKIDQGKPKPAINMLNAFINQVNDFIIEGILTPTEGQALIDAANAIISSLGG